MRTLYYLLRKEFKQIFRDRNILAMITIMPIIQLMVMPLTTDNEIKHINLAIVDNDRSSVSRALVQKITASGYFILTDYANTYPEALKGFDSDKSDIILEIPRNFEKNLYTNGADQLFMAVNAINGTKATMGSNYLGQIVGNFTREKSMSIGKISLVKQIETISTNWYNPLMKYKYFMVPAILVILVTMVSAYMCSVNIVREKEIGTIEQINVTPIPKSYFLMGKLIPFWIIGFFVFTVGYFAVLQGIYGITPQGSTLLLYGFLAAYLFAFLGIGLLISTYSDTQQQAMSLAFFVMMISILMSGMFTPISSMPDWAKWVAWLNPVTYFIDVVRLIILKGSGFEHIKFHFLKMLGFGIVFNTWAILNYRKTS